MYGAFATWYDQLMDDVDYGAWASYLLGLYERALGHRKLKLLDAACGTGNLTIPFSRAGHAVTGADLSEDMLRIAAQKARAAGQKIPFVRQNLTQISLPGRVDVINCACDGVNYLTEEKDVAAFFCSAYDALKEGGVLSFDISSKYKLEHLLDGNTFGEDRGNLAYLWQNAYDPDSGLLEMDLTFFASEDSKTYRRYFERHIQKAHDAEHLKEILLDCGYCDVEIYNAFTNSPPAADSERIQLIAYRR